MISAQGSGYVNKAGAFKLDTWRLLGAGPLTAGFQLLLFPHTGVQL